MHTDAEMKRAVARFHSLCETDCTFFHRVVLGWSPWDGQRRLLRACRDHRRVLGLSGHGVGKTRVLAGLINEWMTTRVDARVVCTASTNRQVRDVLWAEVRRLYMNARVPLGGRVLDREWVMGDGAHAVCVSVDDPTALQGVHSANVLIVVDEAEGLDRCMWDAIDSLMIDERARLVVCANPVNPSGFLFEQAQRPDLWHTERISCLDHPNIASGRTVIPGAVTQAWIDEVRKAHGESSAFWHARVLGQYPKGDSAALLSRVDLEAASAGGLIDTVEAPRAGLDVARFGGDRNVLVIFDEHRVLRHVDSWSGLDLMESTGRALATSKKYGAGLRVDVGGMGAGVVDRLREQGVEVDAVDFGAGAQGDWPSLTPSEMTFANRRAELHWVTRSLVREKSIGIGVEYPEVWADLMLPVMQYDSRGRFKIESKDDMRARAGRSPDFGDAVHIAMSDTVHGVGRKMWVG